MEDLAGDLADLEELSLSGGLHRGHDLDHDRDHGLSDLEGHQQAHQQAPQWHQWHHQGPQGGLHSLQLAHEPDLESPCLQPCLSSLPPSL